MCQTGDIILIEQYKIEDKIVGRHSFVVLKDDGGEIVGIDFDFIALAMGSTKSEEHRKRKLSYPANFPIVPEDVSVKGGNDLKAYVKAEQFFYFQKENLDYEVIGYMKDEILELLIEFIQEMKVPIVRVVDNLKRKEIESKKQDLSKLPEIDRKGKDLSEDIETEDPNKDNT